MPDWAVQISVLLVTGAIAGIGWLFKSRREDQIKRAIRHQTVIDGLSSKNDAMWEKVESQLMDARAYERENSVLRSERMLLDRQFATLTTAMIAALERSEANTKALLIIVERLEARIKDGK